MARSIHFNENTHEESNHEFHRRVQDQMDRDSWVGRDDVGCDFPDKGIVHEIGPADGQDHIYKIGGK